MDPLTQDESPAQPAAAPAAEPITFPPAQTESVPEPTPAPSVPTREQARAKRAQERIGFWMALPWTGGQAHVRLLSMADRSTLVGLPRDQQSLVIAVFEESNKLNAGKLTIERISKNAGHQERLANVLCVAGFLTPRLVPTEADVDESDPHCMVVTDLHIQERIRYFQMATGNQPDEVEKLVPFSDAATTF